MDLIKLVDIGKNYFAGEIEIPVLHKVCLIIKKGEFVALMGASGSGKSTLLNILGCLDRPTVGHYFLEGEDLARLTPSERARRRNEKIGFIFQNFNLLPRTSALENVLMPMSYSSHPLSREDATTHAKSLLNKVGLKDRYTHEPSQLSGGQQQRVAIARALINQPQMLLADEPTGNLDSKTGKEMLAMFRNLNRESGITLLLVTHDPDVAAIADRTIHIVDGQITT